MPTSVSDDISLKDNMIAHLTSPLFITDETELLNFCHGAGFYPVTDRYAVILVGIERWSNLFSSETEWLEISKHHFFVLSNMLTELMNETDIAITAERDFRMVCLVNLKENWDTFQISLREKLQNMVEILESEFNISVTIAVSTVVEKLTSVSAAFRQAADTLWYNDCLGLDQSILFYDDYNVTTRSDTPETNKSVLDQKLLSRLQIRDIAGIKYVLHEMIDREFIHARPAVSLLDIRFGGLACRILDTIEDLAPSIPSEIGENLCPEKRITEAQTITELAAFVDDIFDTISKAQSAAAQEPKPAWVDRMTAFIEENYADSMLGLTEVSDHFGITPSYATRVYKQFTGQGIYEAIQHTRLNAAKAMLASGKTMKEIADQVGYASFLSMNRAFKKYEGTTPSQFKVH